MVRSWGLSSILSFFIIVFGYSSIFVYSRGKLISGSFLWFSGIDLALDVALLLDEEEDDELKDYDFFEDSDDDESKEDDEIEDEWFEVVYFFEVLDEAVLNVDVSLDYF